MAYEALFDKIAEMVMCNSPSGVEEEIDDLLRTRFKALRAEVLEDASGNIIARIPGDGPGRIAISAHKDEIGAIVTDVIDNGRLKVRKLGGSFPWVYGEGVVDVIGDRNTISGVLSFGSRHVSHASPQHAHKETAPLRWSDTWVETKLTKDELDRAGIRVGARVVVGKHRKQPVRLGEYIASYTLDNKASLAVLLDLAERLEKPSCDIDLIASAKEEIGAIGALHYTNRTSVDVMIALEVCPVAPEYPLRECSDPAIIVEDGFVPYDVGLNRLIFEVAEQKTINLQAVAVSTFGSDASLALKQGNVARAACIGFPTQNTHGFEIAHLGAIQNCVELLLPLCQQDIFNRFLRAE